MGKISGVGLVAGAIAWLVIVSYTANQADCMRFNTCKTDDMVLFAIIGLGMLVPSWIVASVVSDMFKK